MTWRPRMWQHCNWANYSKQRETVDKLRQSPEWYGLNLGFSHRGYLACWIFHNKRCNKWSNDLHFEAGTRCVDLPLTVMISVNILTRTQTKQYTNLISTCHHSDCSGLPDNDKCILLLPWLPLFAYYINLYPAVEQSSWNARSRTHTAC